MNTSIRFFESVNEYILAYFLNTRRCSKHGTLYKKVSKFLQLQNDPCLVIFIVVQHIPGASLSYKNLEGPTELCQSTRNSGLTLPGGTAQGSDLHEWVHGPMT